MRNPSRCLPIVVVVFFFSTEEDTRGENDKRGARRRRKTEDEGETQKYSLPPATSARRPRACERDGTRTKTDVLVAVAIWRNVVA